MSKLHKFIFEGMPVRGSLVTLDGAWQEVLRRRAASSEHGAYPPRVAELLGEMTAAAVLLQGSIQFDGTLELQIQGDGPVKLAVAEVQADLGLRTMASLAGPVAPGAGLADLVNAHGRGRCAITLDPRRPGGQPYQGVVPLADESGAGLTRVAAMIEYYMRQSEQLATVLVLAADEQVAAGLMLQRMPGEDAAMRAAEPSRQGAAEDDFDRLAVLARSLQRQELLALDADTILHRLFWNEPLLRFAPDANTPVPHFSCSCSRERVAAMLVQLGREEAEGILRERGQIEVSCQFCGREERFDAVDVARLFTDAAQRHAAAGPLQ